MPALDQSGLEREAVSALTEALLALAKEDPSLITRASLVALRPAGAGPTLPSEATATDTLTPA